ncbi:cisplatin damage response ATP-dependent DNA ligase [Frigidibacter sp. SD6-1]|uniref:cisplatin damage response ATP-dependent DNA ligase n=1 Tax=Frigidibacter sp. SD6-1 TaxID=3032581 RepID=UPI0024DF7600|nr:cisplatin damage response ATP-dependent DNA ligase [Frigidibacter sp. SD6-1]
MKAFARLLARLVTTPSRTGKLRLVRDYLATTPDPDRGYALAALTGGLDLPGVKPALLRALVAERVDEVLFRLSYDYVGDLAETIALIWDGREDSDLPLSEVVHQLGTAGKVEAARVVAGLLDRFDASSRHALIKLATGALRAGLSARLAKTALADHGGVAVDEIEEIWHGLRPPYPELFAWLDGRGPRPAAVGHAPFRPVMLATPLADKDSEMLDPSDFAAEWKWDGIRVQVVCEQGTRRIYTRTGDEISAAFPDLSEALMFEGAFDGELLVRKGDGVAPFADLQQRLNRKTVDARLAARFPAFIRAYDILVWNGEDLRPLPFRDRRDRLETAVAALGSPRVDLSPLVTFDSWTALARHRAEPPDPVIEGLMLKRWDSPYLAGRPKGAWFKWKRDPFLIDAVLMYAQRGHGKRSSYYSDYTFGVWAADGTLTPVGKAYFGFTDEELLQIDRYVRENTTDRFGPVRAVRATRDRGLVVEVAFEGLNRSTRHKSGVAMRFPRISRLRWDKPPSEADTLEGLSALLPPA